MAKTNLLDTRTTSFTELVGNGRSYRVPTYQRDYSWEEDHWEDLWSDLVELRERPDSVHYMGAIVVEGRSDRVSEVIDGQQRLATLSILTLAVIDRLRRMPPVAKAPDANLERAGGLRSRFIGEKDPASLVESSKLVLNATDDGFYQDYLVQLREPVNPRRLPRSNRQLWSCFSWFRRKIEQESSLANDGEALARFVTETVGRQLMFILITVDDAVSAYTVFETLNARGLELSATDLLKNYLFSRLKVEADLKALGRRWQALLGVVGQERFPEFLRYHLQCEEPRVRAQRLFQLIRDRVVSASQVFGLMDILEPRAELFAALADANHAWWIEVPDARPRIREIVLFRVRQMTPTLFAAWECLDRPDFVRVLKLVTVLSFRHSVVGGLNTNELEPVYHRAAKAILDRAARTPRAVFDILRPIYVDDEKFRSDFAEFAIDTNGQRRKLARYVLGILEQDRGGGAFDFETDPATIEHILPENPGQEWARNYPEELWDSDAYRLGNLTLLEASINRRIANASYETKLRDYGESRYAVTRDLPGFAPSEWTPAFVERRQRDFAALAVHLWKADFD